MRALLTLVFGLVCLMAFSETTTPLRLAVHYSGPNRDLLLPSLHATLSRYFPQLWLVDSALGPEISGEDRRLESQRRTIDVNLDVVIDSGTKPWVLTWTLRSPVEEEPRAQGSNAKVPPNASAAVDIFWLSLIEPFQKALAATGPFPRAPLAATGLVRVKALPGTLVEGLGPAPLLVGPEGQVEFPTAVPTSLRLTGSLWTHHSDDLLAPVDLDGAEVSLKQRPISPFVVDGYLTGFSFPGGSFTWNVLPGRAFVRGSLDPYVVGFHFVENDQGLYQSPFVFVDLLSVGVGAGWYLTPPSVWRFYTVADLSTRWMFPEYRFFNLEPVHPIEFRPQVGFELHWGPGSDLFAEVGPSIFWEGDSAASQATRKSLGDAAPFLDLGGFALVNLAPVFKFGYRWTLEEGER